MSTVSALCFLAYAPAFPPASCPLDPPVSNCPKPQGRPAVFPLHVVPASTCRTCLPDRLQFRCWPPAVLAWPITCKSANEDLGAIAMPAPENLPPSDIFGSASKLWHEKPVKFAKAVMRVSPEASSVKKRKCFAVEEEERADR
ncbi:hypothetical protein GGX14DRAFT_553668 [Mycena pura]|uniref:Secreted protein n=1 Tax=Mycena pura TaxID=153505 RepID=A0AAD6YVL7_9AGAR|nr:hypothetical protein GGX14DRAFT_553668 [Mycena pura]